MCSDKALRLPQSFSKDQMTSTKHTYFEVRSFSNFPNKGRGLNSGNEPTADGDCSHEIKRRLLLGRKAITNLESN